MCTLNVTNKVMVCFVVIQERCWIILIWRRPNDQTYRRGRRVADQCTVFERWILVGKPLEIRHCNVEPISRANVDPMSKINNDGPTLSFDVKPTSETTVNRRWTNVTLQTGILYFCMFYFHLFNVLLKKVKNVDFFMKLTKKGICQGVFLNP